MPRALNHLLWKRKIERGWPEFSLALTVCHAYHDEDARYQKFPTPIAWYMNSEPTFEIGLVMAGAVSAGAYTAGVLDFLLQALDTWQDARDAQLPDAPPHNVMIKALSGASAGGILAAMLGTLTNRDVQPAEPIRPPGRINNKLYECWVERLSLERLLQANDLTDKNAPLKSLLDVTLLDEIADYVVADDGRYKYRPYFDKKLHLFLSVTNLRGVPYSIYFQGDSRRGHELSLHADYMHFLLSNAPEAEQDDALRLDPYTRDTEAWRMLRQAALASSAFPGGLAPRLLRRPLRHYNQRKWQIPLAPDEWANREARCYEDQEIAPHWPPSYVRDLEQEYQFLCVDGGLMNNEPLELARRALAGNRQRNPREGRLADCSVIMIDPFPDPVPFDVDYQAEDTIFSVLTAMFSSLKYQTRFKPEELKLAMREDVYSRFLISPSRRDSEGRPREPALACAALNAFGGFLSRDFRLHDFQLGRRNCQRFLGRHFLLPEDNPLFQRWPEAPREHYLHVNRRGERFLPIVPLMPTLRREIPEPEWPRLPPEILENLRRGFKFRGDAVVNRLLRDQGLWRWLGLLVWKMGLRGRVINQLMTHVRDDLKRRGLYHPEK